jgi:thioredoxin 1
MSNLLNFTDANFDAEVLQSDVPVLVDFAAPWCQPCRLLAPLIEKIAADYAGRAKVGKLEAEDNRDTVIKYGISSLPTVIVFRNGQVAAHFRGLKSDRDYREALDHG